MCAHPFDEPDLVGVHIILEVAVEAAEKSQLEKFEHCRENCNRAKLLALRDVGPDFVQGAKSGLKTIFHLADDVPSPQISEKVQLFRVFNPRIAEPVEGQSLTRLAATLQSLNLLIGERREAREVVRERRDADCGPGYFLEHSKTVLNYRFLTGVKLVVGIKEAVHYPAVPSGRVDDHESTEQLVGYARFLAA